MVLYPFKGLDPHMTTSHWLGLHTMAKELSKGVRFWKQIEHKESIDALQEMFSTSSADEKEDEIMSLTEGYHKFKREYVKHLAFNPDNKQLSKVHVYDFMVFVCFSDLAGARAPPGGVHLLWHSNLWWNWKGRKGLLVYVMSLIMKVLLQMFWRWQWKPN